MSFEITDQVKYRLTGGIILIALVSLCMPIMMKKSNQRFEENLSLNLKAPPKPKQPVLNIPTAQQVFNKVKNPTPKVAPSVAERPIEVKIAKAESLESFIPSISMDMVEKITTEPVNSNRYGVQIASFSRAENAVFLVKRLKTLGYAATSTMIKNNDSKLYKVVVGNLKNKDAALNLQKKLANNTQLEGIVIKQG